MKSFPSYFIGLIILINNIMKSKSITLSADEINNRIDTACRFLSRKKFTEKQLKQFLVNGKNPDKTKRTKSGYQLFLDDYRTNLSKEERANFGQVSTDGASLWNILDSDIKQDYLDEASELKEMKGKKYGCWNDVFTDLQPQPAWHPRDDVDDTIPEGWEMDDLGGVCDGDITWREDGKYITLVVDEDGEEDMEWIFPKDTPKGEKIPEFPQELKDFYDGKIYQAWKKVSPQAHQVVLRSHQVGVTGWRKFLDRDPPFGKL